jgi:hypothetical protein
LTPSQVRYQAALRSDASRRAGLLADAGDGAMPKIAVAVVVASLGFVGATGVSMAQDKPALRVVRFPHSVGQYGYLPGVGPYYPERAERENESGEAEIACHVALDGGLNDCVPVRETGTWGFGDASLAMAKRRWILAKPKSDGSAEDLQAVEHFRVEFRIKRGRGAY